MGQRGILRTLTDDQVGFWCPGCEQMHVVRIPPHQQAWSFNDDYDRPTFSPSVLVRGHECLTDAEHVEVMRGNNVVLRLTVCHSFVKDGVIDFLPDCTHRLAGQQVQLTARPTDDE